MSFSTVEVTPSAANFDEISAASTRGFGLFGQFVQLFARIARGARSCKGENIAFDLQFVFGLPAETLR